MQKKVVFSCDTIVVWLQKWSVWERNEENGKTDYFFLPSDHWFKLNISFLCKKKKRKIMKISLFVLQIICWRTAC